MVFPIGTTVSLDPADLAIRKQLLEDAGFEAPGEDCFFELVGPYGDLVDHEMVKVALRGYEKFVRVIHAPICRGKHFMTGLTDLSNKLGRDHLADCLTLADKLGVRKVMAHSDVIRKERLEHGPGLRAVQQRVFDNLKILSERASYLGIALCIENLPPQVLGPDEPEYYDLSGFDDPIELATITAATKLRSGFDTCHCAVRRPDIASVYRTILTEVDHIHASDLGLLDANPGFYKEGAVPGTGIIPNDQWREFLSLIPDNMTVTLEVNNPHRYDPQCTWQAIAKFRQWTS